MADLKLSQSFSLIALNAQDSLYMTTAKKAALRCMAASVILEIYLEGGFMQSGDKLSAKRGTDDLSNLLPYRDAVLDPLIRRDPKINRNLNWWLKRASALPMGKLAQLEYAMADSLKYMDLLEEIPQLLGCDLYYVTSGVSVREYRGDIDEYSAQTEYIRAEILEDGSVTDETICMLWLLRESGCMHDFFSRNELEKVAVRMDGLAHSSPLAKQIYPMRIHRGAELAIKEMLHMKSAVLTTPMGSGINFAFPILERSHSVFIDTEEWFPDPQKRLEDVEARLSGNGHVYKTISRNGPVSLIKIDNIIYEAVPQAITVSRVPIHGVRLLPRYPGAV